MATVSALDHIVLVARDVEATLAWYQRHLGFEAVRLGAWRAGEVPFPSLRVTPSTIIDVVAGEPGGPTGLAGPGHLAHVCFVVDDEGLDAARADPDLVIEDEGTRFGARGNARSVYVRDPDGLTVELRAYPPGA
ncbi:MAG: VOC family virulence protein [Acidimicrobiia bacterium]|nr:VOC family virulence protein [Acidimicrobiia bacterium]